MQKKTLCFLVLGASLGMLLQNLAKRRALAGPRPVTRSSSGEVIDFTAWKESRNRNQLAV
ncbi:hypothetical protein [Hyphomicrobium sp.]|uniref:hypothetical protein n=1 Tax=Hyphomicrobium sp. TaxID=82 RepID=UPI002E33D5A4|nr:hypothetical protein [Hyphomicrobium sp.]HEX2840791.1 hypothetical protein [Hyphomicrobium sp.]